MKLFDDVGLTIPIPACHAFQIGLKYLRLLAWGQVYQRSNGALRIVHQLFKQITQVHQQRLRHVVGQVVKGICNTETESLLLSDGQGQRIVRLFMYTEMANCHGRRA